MPAEASAKVCSIPVDNAVSISCYFYPGNKRQPNMLFFHGNGEIAAEYGDIASVFNEIGINLFVADYRGYGTSGGSPTLTDMVKDAHPIFDGFKRLLKEESFSGNLFVMGRSLGSLSAIELAYHYQNQLSGLVVESGFASVSRLLQRLGLGDDSRGSEENEPSTGPMMVRGIAIPTLVLHGEYDQLVSFEEGKAIYDNVAANDKRFVLISGADHNTIFVEGMEQYLRELQDFIAAHSR